ncbi:hypothetical protein HY486_04520 [Candidatus Woesearchaeota archaeon]|nr:hypothetical protein [Candidatus Woesearchaeota archaeon]
MQLSHRNISYAIVILASILSVISVLPLFNSGIPMNIDSPCHYLRSWCVANVDSSVPNNWCNFWQAGVPVSQYYYPLVDFLTAFIGKFIGLVLSYKLFLVLTLFAQPVGAYVLLRSLGHELAAGFAFALLVLNPGSWHFAGFEEVFLVGLSPYVLSIGFWLLGMASFLYFLRSPSFKSLVLAVIPTLFITHPMTLIFAAVSYVFLAVVHYKQLLAHRKLVFLFAFSVLIINAYYIIPFLLKLELFPRAIGGWIDWNDFLAYVWSRVPFLLWVFAFAGLLFMNKQLRFLSVLVGFWTIVNLLPRQSWHDYLIGIRFGAILAPFVFISASVVFERLAKIRKYAPLFLLVSLLVFTPFVWKFFSKSRDLGKSILLSEHEVFSSQKEAYKFLSLKEGRVLAEETLYNANDARAFTHSNCILPVVSGKELIGSGLILFPRNRTVMDIGISSMAKNLFHRPFSDYNVSDVLEILQDYNIRWIVVHTNVWFDYFKNFAIAQYGFGSVGVLEMPVNNSWFKANGQILSEKYEGMKAEAAVVLNNSSQVILKTHYYPNWKAFVDNLPVKSFDCNGLLCAQVPAGSHSVLFVYKTQFSEWLGYLLSLLGIVLIGWLWRKPQ